MEVLVCIGVLAVGAVIGAVTMALLASSKYAEVLDDMYEKGLEDGQKMERQKWINLNS